MREDVRYELPFGKMGIVVTAAVVEKIDVLTNCGLPLEREFRINLKM